MDNNQANHPTINNNPQPAGNSYNKYESKNPLVKILMAGFLHSLNHLITQTNATDIHEIGCGEGYLSTGILSDHNRTVRGSDISPEMVDRAKSKAIANGLPPSFKLSSIYDLKPETDSAELIVCCEVLEHLQNPEIAMSILSRLANPYLLLSVPKEPVWRILNLLRGKYLSQWGNTPGHIQHWSKSTFLSFISNYVDIIEIKTPLPWIMLLTRTKPH